MKETGGYCCSTVWFSTDCPLGLVAVHKFFSYGTLRMTPSGLVNNCMPYEPGLASERAIRQGPDPVKY